MERGSEGERERGERREERGEAIKIAERWQPQR
jgi:hypothetical protein